MIRVVHPGSRIRMLTSTHPGSRIPDIGVKKAPDPGSAILFVLNGTYCIRKKAALSLDSRYVTMVENAYYLVSPPDSPLEARKERPPMHQYIRFFCIFFGHFTSGLSQYFRVFNAHSQVY
jgi:hypothetical protein